MVWGNGFCRATSISTGVMARVNSTEPHCFVLGPPELGKLILGRKSGRSYFYIPWATGTDRSASSLVIDTLCDQSVGENIAVACFYCDFQYQKMQTPENILGALIKQLIRGLGAIPTEIHNAFRKS